MSSLSSLTSPSPGGEDGVSGSWPPGSLPSCSGCDSPGGRGWSDMGYPWKLLLVVRHTLPRPALLVTSRATLGVRLGLPALSATAGSEGPAPGRPSPLPLLPIPTRETPRPNPRPRFPFHLTSVSVPPAGVSVPLAGVVASVDLVCAAFATRREASGDGSLLSPGGIRLAG